jgi:hypothetical protein
MRVEYLSKAMKSLASAFFWSIFHSTNWNKLADEYFN